MSSVAHFSASSLYSCSKYHKSKSSWSFTTEAPTHETFDAGGTRAAHSMLDGTPCYSSWADRLWPPHVRSESFSRDTLLCSHFFIFLLLTGTT